MPRPVTPAALYGLVALSGAAGLAFQLLWIRALGLYFGTTAPAITTVVAAFMAGLAAGNHVFGAAADRSERPFALYQRLELGIAGSGLLVSLLVLRASDALEALSRLCEQAGPMSGALRALALSVLMLAPTTLMGGTLPVLSRALSRRGQAGRALGLLYACNTLGAIFGALLPDFVLIPRWGMTAAALAAAGCNVTVAIGVGVLLHRGRLHATSAAAEPEPRLPAHPTASPHARATALVLAACSGFAALGLEVLWSRTLQHWTAALVTSFSVLLSLNLAGLSLGALITRRLADRAAHPLRVASALLSLTGASVLAPIATASAWRDLERTWWPRDPELRRLGLWTEAGDALLHASYLEAVPCLLMGASFPFVAAACVRGGHTGARTGQLFMVNTLAGVLGALVMGFVCLRTLGQQASYVAFALLLTVVAALCNALLSARWPSRVAGAGGLVVVLALVVFLPRDALSRAHFRSGGHVVAVREGSTTTAAAALRTAYGQPYYAELLTPGVSMSNTGPHARRYMAMLGHAALLGARDARRALLICYGVGNTASALLSHARLERLDVVEISREVLSLAPKFARARGANPLADPRVRVFVDDGRHHLLVRDERYDVITAEPPPPNHAGVVNLYSREFYRLARRRLAPSGVIAQWLPVFELSDREVRAMIAAFVAELPHTALLYGYREHLILLGSPSPLAVDAARAAEVARDPTAAQDLLRSGIGDVDDVLGAVVATDAELRREASKGVPVTDDLPSIQYPYEGVREDSTYASNLALGRHHARALLAPGTGEVVRLRVERAARATRAAIDVLPALRLQLEEAWELAVGRRLTPALRARPANAGVWSLLSLAPDRVRAAEAALRTGTDDDGEAAFTLLRHAFYAGDYALALDRAQKIVPAPRDRALHALLRGGSLRALGRFEDAAAAFREAAARARDPGFGAAARQLAALAAAPFEAEAGPFSLESRGASLSR